MESKKIKCILLALVAMLRSWLRGQSSNPEVVGSCPAAKSWQLVVLSQVGFHPTQVIKLGTLHW